MPSPGPQTLLLPLTCLPSQQDWAGPGEGLSHGRCYCHVLGGQGRGSIPEATPARFYGGLWDVQEAKRAWGHRTLVLGGLRAHLSPLGSLPQLWALELIWRAGGGNPQTNVLNLKTAGKAEREMGREGRGGGPLVDPGSLLWEMCLAAAALGDCHPETGCSQTPVCAWLSGGGAGPEKGSSRGEAGWWE